MVLFALITWRTFLPLPPSNSPDAAFNIPGMAMDAPMMAEPLINSLRFILFGLLPKGKPRLREAAYTKISISYTSALQLA
jgi:hypothetical protein